MALAGGQLEQLHDGAHLSLWNVVSLQPPSAAPLSKLGAWLLAGNGYGRLCARRGVLFENRTREGTLCVAADPTHEPIRERAVGA